MNIHNATLSLDNRFSTTKNLFTEPPNIENNADDKFETLLFLPQTKDRKGEGGLRTKGYFKASLPNQPLITVITVVFNGNEHLEETILSVINQTYENIEYIIIDGGSTDGTLDIIQMYDSVINYWVSEADQGIYDAMNKALSIASDSHIYFLGAGDLIISLPKKIELMSNKIIMGIVKMSNNSFFNSRYDWMLKLGNTLHHQGLLVHKSLYSDSGFNIHYKIYADYDFNIKIYKKGISFFFSKSFIGYALPNGVSSKLNIRESLEIIGNNFGCIWQIIAILYYIFQGFKYGFNRLSFFS